MISSIKTVVVCGAGTMGSGIAQLVATHGYHTVLVDVQETALQKAKQTIAAVIQKQIEKGRLEKKQREVIWGRLSFTTDIKEPAADLVIEAIVEDLSAKISLFQQFLAGNPSCIYASNTSSLSLTAMAEQLGNRVNLLGLHFFNPAPLMKLVEVVYTPYTAPNIIETIVAFASSLQKTPVICKDAPGFIVNRVARPYYIESLRLLEEQKASVDTIDRLLEAQGFKMGPFRLMDLIGNDINYAVSCSVYEQLNKPPRLQPSLIQKEKVEKGELGRKTGKGYYEY